MVAPARTDPGLAVRLPLFGRGLLLPDATRVELRAVQADDQFAGIFRSACRSPATDDELATVDGYTVNILLSGPGGSLQAARRMIRPPRPWCGPAARECPSTTARWPMADRSGSK